ncbi:hemolysin family protein [Glycomyces buryatensis]|uniref:HlyC/CorC family transporter n=1 Tax=Glycomyces buryatensis TaxID=2570927 RepID=A0A4S8QDE1_9ACTN|nr:hemolysin family protein [Glycomyces buryatensis]THV40915.1 HlyC/CorC family transporter [Glycomyces buryatensis]
MSTGPALLISLVLLLANAFFVAAEFALVASRQHRLEQDGSGAANAALRATKRLSIMLAGAQLGITVCTVGLGALAEPALAHFFEVPLHAIGLEAAAHPIAFTVALVIVVFLHMVVGEMMPKSWAISHPESSAMALIWPFTGWVVITKPLLLGLNHGANVILRMFKVEPADEKAQAHSPEELRYLLRSSAEAGMLGEGEHQMLTHAIEVQRRSVGEVAIPWGEVVTISSDATAAGVEARSRASGRSRLVVVDSGDRPVGLVHVREAVQAEPAEPIAGLAAAPLLVDAATTVSAAVALMRRQRSQLAIVTGPGPDVTGLVAMEDLLEEIMGDFYDETDKTV